MLNLNNLVLQGVKMSEIKRDKRNTKFMELKGYLNEENDFIEITEWSNGEGFDIQTHENGLGMQRISWSYSTIDALIHLYTDKGE
jgi:hypothetical protein